MKTYKNTIKMLDVAAEKPVQIFKYNTVDLDSDADAILDAVLSVNFERAVLFDNKIILQGLIHKNIIYKETGGDVLHQSVDIPFAEEVEAPGFKPSVKIGKFNRVTLGNNVVLIGPDNHGVQDGIDVQIYITRFVSEEILINSDTVDEKVVLEVILKISKYTQREMSFAYPAPTFEFRNVVSREIDC